MRDEGERQVNKKAELVHVDVVWSLLAPSEVGRYLLLLGPPREGAAQLT